MINIFENKKVRTSSPVTYCTIDYEYQRINGTDVRYRFKWRVWIGSQSWDNNALNMRIFLNGSTTPYIVTVKGVTSGKGWDKSGTTAWYTIKNKLDGTVSFYIDFMDMTDASHPTWGKTDAYKLTVPVCRATITSAPNFNNTQSPKISYSNPLGNNVTKLEACISLTGAAADVPYREIERTKKEYTFELTEQEMNTLINSMAKNVTSRKVYFFIQTTYQGYKFRHSVEKVFYLVNGEPVLSDITITDSNSKTSALTGNTSKFIKYYSDAAVSFKATAKYGGSITSYKVVCGDKTLNSSSDTIKGVESGTFSITATDSRGFSTTQTIKKDLIEYVKLTCALSVNIVNPAQGTVNYTLNGNQFNGSFGTVQNAVTKKLLYKEVGTSAWQEKILTSNSGSLTLDYTKSWEIKATVSDKIITTPIESKIYQIVFEPSFYWDKDNFYFNQNVFFKENISISDIIKETYYSDKETLTSSFWGAGFVTSGGTEIYFTIPLRKSLANITSITVNSMSICARQGGKYILGTGSSFQDCKASGYTTKGTFKDGALSIMIKKTSAFTNVTNNDSVGIWADYTLTFNSSVETGSITQDEIIAEEIETEGNL